MAGYHASFFTAFGEYFLANICQRSPTLGLGVALQKQRRQAPFVLISRARSPEALSCALLIVTDNLSRIVPPHPLPALSHPACPIAHRQATHRTNAAQATARQAVHWFQGTVSLVPDEATPKAELEEARIQFERILRSLFGPEELPGHLGTL